MALACPVCHGDMEPLDYLGLKLDVCPESAGIWFDSGELFTLAKANPEAMKELDDRFVPQMEVVAPEPQHKKCPRCHTVLERTRYRYDSPVSIDSCANCHGVFVEEQELAAIQKSLSGEKRARMTAVMQSRARLSGRPEPTPEGRNRDADVAALIHALAHWRERAGAQTEGTASV